MCLLPPVGTGSRVCFSRVLAEMRFSSRLVRFFSHPAHRSGDRATWADIAWLKGITSMPILIKASRKKPDCVENVSARPLRRCDHVPGVNVVKLLQDSMGCPMGSLIPTRLPTVTHVMYMVVASRSTFVRPHRTSCPPPTLDHRLYSTINSTADRVCSALAMPSKPSKPALTASS